MDNPKSKPYLTRRGFLQLGAAATAVGVLQEHNPAATAATPASSPKRGGTFTLARTMTTVEFNPFYTVMGHYAYMRALYNTLLHYDEKLEPQPELAEKWEFSPDGKTMTLKLRQGVRFHSGREFTSADVKSTWEFVSTDISATMRAMYRMIKQVETPDKYTAVLKFDNIYPGIFDLLDMLYILDKDTLADRAKTAIGTGPFRLDRYIPNDRIEMVAFKDYWEQGKPYLDRYVARQIPDLASLAINLESGAVDCIWQPNNFDYARLKSSGKFVCDLGAPGPTLYDVAINVTVDPFQNKKVRQAIAWSIDRPRFCRAVLQGLVEPTCLMWASHSWAYFKDLEGKIGFDLDKAKALLKEAGLEKGFTTEIMTASKRGLGYGDLAQIMQADLKKIGVNAKIIDLEIAQYEARSLKGDIVIMIHSYGRANRDPGTLVAAAKAWQNEKEGNWTHWNSPEWDALRKELNSILDQDKRKATARKLQEMALDECFTVVVAPQQRTWAYAPHVKGFTYDLENTVKVGDIWLEK